MKKLSIIFLGFLITSCGGDTNKKYSEEQSFLSFKQKISESYSDSNIVTSVERTDIATYFTFQAGSFASISNSLIKNIVIDHEQWSVTLTISNGELFELIYLGSIPEIEEDVYEKSDILPLVMKLKMDFPVSGKLGYRVVGQNGSFSDFTSTPIPVSEGSNEFFIIGLYPDSINEVEIKFMSDTNSERFKKIINITTSPLVGYFADERMLALPDIRTLINNEPDIQRFYLFDHRSLPCSGKAFIIDQYGDIRWVMIQNVSYGLHQSSTGNLIFASGSEFTELSLDGSIHNVYSLPPPYSLIHHDLLELPDGRFILTVNNSELETIEDVFILFNPQTGMVDKKWDLNEILPKSFVFINDPLDWFHGNAIDHDYRDNSLLISGQRFGIVKVSWDNQLEWILTDSQRLGDFSFDPKYSNKLLSSSTGESITWGQHDIQIDEKNDKYYLFDNGLGRNYSNTVEYSRGVTFSIDLEEKAFFLEDQYGEDYAYYFSPIISGIHFNERGDTLVNFGAIGYKFDYIDANNWIQRDTARRVNPAFGSAWLEYNEDNELIKEVQISCLTEDLYDVGIYRARYVSLH